MPRWWSLLSARAKTITAVLALVIVTNGALTVMDQVRWWIWSWEFSALADTVYNELTIPQQRRVISQVQRDLERAKDKPPARRSREDINLINNLEEEKASELVKLENLQKRAAKYTRWKRD